MKLSKLERETLLNKKPKLNVRDAIKNHPGRIVKIKTAEARVQRRRMSIDEACTTPLITQRERHGARREKAH